MNEDSKTQENLHFYGQLCTSLTIGKNIVIFMGMNRILGYYNLHYCVYLTFSPHAPVSNHHFPLEALFLKTMEMLVRDT